MPKLSSLPTIPLISFSPHPPKSTTHLTNSLFVPLKSTNLNLRTPKRRKQGFTISGQSKRLELAGDYVGNNGGLSVFMCSTTPFIGFGGRVGMQRREGSVSLLSFGVNSNQIQISGVDSKSGSNQFLSALLPFVVAATAIAALSQPSTFTWVSKDLYAPALGGIMLSIGIRLSIKDFALAFQRPLPLSIGLIAQYVLKPVLGVLIAQAFGMSSIFYAGFVLTACVSGAQLSSYASFLSNGDVALSILLTSSSTIASVLVTPLLTRLLIGAVIPVDAVAMSKSILQADGFS